MGGLSYKTKAIISGLAFLVLLLYFGSCKKDDLLDSENNVTLSEKLSDYNIFQGKPSDLIPANGYQLYEISTQLFSDYAEKQRLIKVPSGNKITAVNNGLPDFPDGTILVKTFYYFNDKRDPSKGKKLIETRLLIKSNAKWNVGTYLWNNEQTEAILLTAGINKTVNWINENGTGKVTSFHVPSNRECATCHVTIDAPVPLGLKIRNLNIDVVRDSVAINQLTHFQNIGIINTLNTSSFSRLPNWQNASLPISERARAYLDVNCAHCHNENRREGILITHYDYELSLSETNISLHKTQIIDMLSEGAMPRLGTTLIDDEAVSLIKKYLDDL